MWLERHPRAPPLLLHRPRPRPPAPARPSVCPPLDLNLASPSNRRGAAYLGRILVVLHIMPLFLPTALFRQGVSPNRSQNRRQQFLCKLKVEGSKLKVAIHRVHVCPVLNASIPSSSFRVRKPGTAAQPITSRMACRFNPAWLLMTEWLFLLCCVYPDRSFLRQCSHRAHSSSPQPSFYAQPRYPSSVRSSARWPWRRTPFPFYPF